MIFLLKKEYNRAWLGVEHSSQKSWLFGFLELNYVLRLNRASIGQVKMSD
jgi:hypothetical protein